jgi:4-methylaminobutanoate oxidase (formaldehyde-forming)
MEKGYRYYGTDLTLLDNPFEAGLGFCVRRDKWPGVSPEVKRRLRTLVVGDHEYLTIYGGEAVRHGDQVVGRVRSCAYGFTVRANLAYSYVPVELEPGARVDVEVFGERVPAVVTKDAVVAKNAVVSR